MDKNSWIGLALIAAIMFGFSWLNKPSKEDLARRQAYYDSVMAVQQQEALMKDSLRALEIAREAELEALEAANPEAAQELAQARLAGEFGAFAPSATGENTLHVVENNLLRLTFQEKGGVLHAVELKDYKAYGDTINPLCLFRGEESELGYTFVTKDGKVVNTKDLYFEYLPVSASEAEQVVTLRLHAKAEKDAYMDFVYTIPADDYMIAFKMVNHNMDQVLAQNVHSVEMDWRQSIPQQEKGRSFEARYSQLQYMFMNGDIEKLSERSNDSEDETGKIRWIAYKDQFFSTVMIADEGFEGATMESTPMTKGSGYMKEYKTQTAFEFDPAGKKATGFRLYFGPNKYNTLAAYDNGVARDEKLHLKEMVPLGWNMVSWVNKILTIPMFDLFSSWGLSMGLIILLMTIAVKLIILPFTFKSYQSTAKMRVLKPEMDAINAKYPEDKMQERQQAMMALYSKAGVSPMSGCLPMLLQMPIVMALFWFFPTAIELRGQSFLWADDLSTYDAIIEWGFQIPVISWFTDSFDHLSLFTLLFVATNLVYTWLNMQTQAASGPGAGMMKWMMYMMPLMFFFIFNDYAAGLSYYYFLSLLFSIVQTYVFRLTINDEKVRDDMAKAQAKRANKKKSPFMERLEKMQREQQQRMREQVKEQSKKAHR